MDDLKDMDKAISRIEVALKKGEKRNPRQVDPETCTGCNMCLQTGCPAISLTPEGKARIDAVVCNGCPICQQVCKAGAIHEAT